MTATLIAFSGLPGSGKSTIARELAGKIGAVWLRIDTIEQAIRDSGIVPGPVDDAGYRAAYGLAEDNLRLGLSVVADCVNDCMLARNAWRDVAARAGARIVEVESICADLEEHRRRVETRTSDVPRLALPTWQAVIGREYEAWDRDPLRVDTASRGVDACVAAILAAL
ncbi:MAG TPA: AAA family ATPase [Roseiarcus sp.]